MKSTRYTIRLCLFAVVALGFFSCKGSVPSAERSDYIRVYDSREGDTPLDRAVVSVKGGKYTYYIRSNVDFSARWQSEDTSWAEIGSPRRVSEGLWAIDVTVEPVSERVLTTVNNVPTGLYTRRYGVLMITNQDIFLGKYLIIEQGLEPRISCNFSWLYGAADPNDTYSDVLMSHWTTAQQNQGFTSTLIDGEDDKWVYSKDGYVKLGNSRGAGADLITPRSASFQYDTLLVVSFRAVVQSGDALPDFTGGTEPIVPNKIMASRAKENNAADGPSLTVEVTGGGFIRDFVGSGGTSLNLDLSTYIRESPSFPADIFDDGAYLVFIEGTESNPITVNTAIRFIAGGMKGSDDGTCSRVFLDDVFVYRQDLLLDEDLFLLNGEKSGKDIVTGGKKYE